MKFEVYPYDPDRIEEVKPWMLLEEDLADLQNQPGYWDNHVVTDQGHPGERSFPGNTNGVRISPVRKRQ